MWLLYVRLLALVLTATCPLRGACDVARAVPPPAPPNLCSQAAARPLRGALPAARGVARAGQPSALGVAGAVGPPAPPIP